MAKRKRETIWSFDERVKEAHEALVENRRLTNLITRDSTTVPV
jgi:hypothetical protein